MNHSDPENRWVFLILRDNYHAMCYLQEVEFEFELRCPVSTENLLRIVDFPAISPGISHVLFYTVYHIKAWGIDHRPDQEQLEKMSKIYMEIEIPVDMPSMTVL